MQATTLQNRLLKKPSEETAANPYNGGQQIDQACWDRTRKGNAKRWNSRSESCEEKRACERQVSPWRSDRLVQGSQSHKQPKCNEDDEEGSAWTKYEAETEEIEEEMILHLSYSVTALLGGIPTDLWITSLTF